MHFNSETDNVSFIDLYEVNSCKLIPTTENNSDIIVKIEFEFQFKENHKKELILFYTIEEDQLGQICLYENHQLAKKWTKIIQDCISA